MSADSDLVSFGVQARIVGSEVRLNVKSATIKMDEYYSPYIQATLECEVSDRATIAAVDPTREVSVLVTVTERYATYDQVSDITTAVRPGTVAALTAVYQGDTLAAVTADYRHPFGDPGFQAPVDLGRDFLLILRGRRINHREGTVTLTLASEESLLRDDAHIGTGPIFPPGAVVVDIVRDCLNRINRTLPPITTSNTAFITPVPEGLREWKPGVTAWEYLTPIIRKAGLFLWTDEFGIWWLTESHSTEGAQLTLSSETNVIDATDDIDRDSDWYTAVQLTYRWTGAAGLQQEVFEAFNTLAPVTRVYTATIDRPYPGPGVAAEYMKKLRAQSRINEVTAIPSLLARVGGEVTVDVYDLPIQTGRVSSLELRFPADTMTIRTRQAITT